MTNPKSPNQHLSKIRTALTIGSLAAAILGTKLVANKDMAIEQQPAIVVPAELNQGQSSQQSLTSGRSSNNFNFNLQPMPTIVAPRFTQPLTRSRSSR